MGISKNLFHHYTRLLGIEDVARQERARAKLRFRLPPLDKTA